MMRYLWSCVWESIRGAGRRPLPKRRRQDRRHHRLCHEPLEPRRLLAATSISFDAGTGQILIRGTAADDQVVVSTTSTGMIRVRATTGGEEVVADFARSVLSSIDFGGGDGNDRFVNGTDLPSRARGEYGDDELIGGSGSDFLIGGDGNDRLVGYAGDDDLRGQDGDDVLLGLDGNDLLSGGLGRDELRGGDGNDRLAGEWGDDTLFGDAGNDELLGLDGNDVLSGGIGDDLLLGGIGNDRLVGEWGDDDLRGQEGDDELLGLDGRDVLTGGMGNDVLRGGDDNDRLVGEWGDDTLFGDAGDDELLGADGHDVIMGGDGNDTLYGGDGNDRLVGELGDDRLFGQAGDDELLGLKGNDVLTGGMDADDLHGGEGNDRLVGEWGDDELFGDAGDDELLGLDGNDALSGGFGNDTLKGGDGNDRLVGDWGNDSLFGEAGNDELLGLEDSDVLTGGTGNDVLRGGDGNDRLVGEWGDDELFGDAGNDELLGLDGNDVLSGGVGNDTLRGGDGNDRLVGEWGDDSLFGDAGDDELLGLDGNDLLNGGADDDSLMGGIGDDVLEGSSGNDELRGQDGHDFLLGGSGDDSLYGGGNNDVLVGGLGADQLFGEWDSDLLIGGITDYDGSTAGRNAILQQWSSIAPYAARIQSLVDEAFSARLQSEETVFDDQVADALFGGDGEDWFFQTGYMGVYRPADVVPAGQDDGDQHASFVSDQLPYLEGFALIDALDKYTDRETTEAVHSVMPHASNPVLQREHLAMFELVRYDQVTHYAVSSGAWSDPATWHNGILPGDGARVLIPIGVEVTVDGVVPARLATVRIDGTLRFSTTASSELRVDTIIGSGSSRLEMGTVGQPIPAAVTARLLIIDNGPIDRDWDPFGISRGLLTHGSVSLHGAEVTSHVAVEGSALAGARNVLLATDPVGWKVGDSIVFAATTEGTEQNETRTITRKQGRTIFFNQPLDYDHVAPAPELSVHVANLTRNVRIASENWSYDHRGHVMFMHNRDVDVSFAGFYHLGRTDKLVPINDPVVDANWNLMAGTGTNPRARYAVHFHRNGLVNDGNPAVVRGSVVDGSPGWGFVNHSSYVDMLDNVAYNVHGAAFTTEVGDEIGRFDGNIAIGSSGSGAGIESRTALQDFGHQGDGFWFQGAGVSVTNNVAAGNQGNAFAYFTRGLVESGLGQGRFRAENLPDPSIAGGADTIAVNQVPVTRFENNVGYASATGLNVWYLLENVTHAEQAVFADSQFWNNTQGVYIPYTRQTVLRNLTVIHSPEVRPFTGIGSNTVARDVTYDNLTVIGYQRGLSVTRSGYSLVLGGFFANEIDIMIHTGVSSDREVLITGPLVQPRVVMGSAFNPINDSTQYIFGQDTVRLDYGVFYDQRLYYPWQRADAVPFPEPRDGLPSQYVGLTQQQLSDQYGVAVGGEIAPANVYEVPSITGLIGPPGG